MRLTYIRRLQDLPRKASHGGYVYVIVYEKVVKVGCTKDPWSRVRGQVRHGKASGMNPGEIFLSDHLWEYGRVEKECHVAVRNHFAIPSKNESEYFPADSVELVNVIAGLDTKHPELVTPESIAAYGQEQKRRRAAEYAERYPGETLGNPGLPPIMFDTEMAKDLSLPLGALGFALRLAAVRPSGEFESVEEIANLINLDIEMASAHLDELLRVGYFARPE